MKEIKVIADIKKAIIEHPCDVITKTTVSSDGRKVMVEYNGKGSMRACVGILESDWIKSPRELRQWLIGHGLELPMKSIRVY